MAIVPALLPRSRVLGLLAAAWTGCSPFPSSPFVVTPPSAPVERVYAGGGEEWTSRLARIADVGPDRIIPTFSDVTLVKGPRAPWATDAWIFGSQSGHSKVLQMPSLPDWAEWASRHFQDRVIAAPTDLMRSSPSRFDQGGNLLVLPSRVGHFPHGRILVGRDMDTALKRFFMRQRVQTDGNGALIEIDTSWLKVGHVDEVVAVLPLSGTLVFPDPEAGLRLLSEVPPERALFLTLGSAESSGQATSSGPRFLVDENRDFGAGDWRFLRIISGRGAGQVAVLRRAEGHTVTVQAVWDLRGSSPSAALHEARDGSCEKLPVWFEPPDSTSRYIVAQGSKMWLDARGEPFPALLTAGELAADPHLRSVSKAVDRRIHGDIALAQIVADALGIPREELVRLPALFIADSDGTTAWPLLPNPVNLINLNDGVALLRPFGPRREPIDDESDVFMQAWRKALTNHGIRAHFLDGWDTLHRSGGGARCGANVLRRTLP